MIFGLALLAAAVISSVCEAAVNASGLVGLQLDGNDLSITVLGNSSVKLPLALPLVGRLSTIVPANVSFTYPAGNYSTEPLSSTIFNITLGSLGAEQGFTPEVFASARLIQIYWTIYLASQPRQGPAGICPVGVSAECCNASMPWSGFGTSTTPWCAAPFPWNVPPDFSRTELASPLWLWAGPPYQPFPLGALSTSQVGGVLFPGVHFGPSSTSFKVVLRSFVNPGQVVSGSSSWFSSCPTSCEWPYSFQFPSTFPNADPYVQDFWGTVYI
jgi:hypothetical protein